VVSEEKSKALLQCNKCGFCLAHCPIYKATGLESTAARGRIALIRSALLNNELETDEIKDIVTNCLTCRACTDDCPAAVPTADIILSTREELLKKYGNSRMMQTVFEKVLPNPSLLQKTTGLLRLADATGLRAASDKTGLLKLMGDAGKASKMVPKVPSRRGLRNIGRLAKKLENPKYKVAFFVGCFAANFGTEEAAATIRILHKHRADVTVPEFACCGLPAAGYGDTESAKAMARANLEIAKNLDVDAIITTCASCSSYLKDYGKLLGGDPEWAEAAKAFSAKVKDISEFLVGIGLNTEMGTIIKKVTYHDPCHLARYQKIKSQPRAILKSIPGIDFVEMVESDICCGAAGTYGFKNYDLSMQVLARKMGNVEKTGAQILLSSCPACIMQLSSGVKERKLPMETMALVRLLDQSYQNKKPGK
jgi:glycolate oxidase iron-sulfur subunit